jgi:hypothetical protein
MMNECSWKIFINISLYLFHKPLQTIATKHRRNVSWVQGSHYFQIRGRSDFSFRELTGYFNSLAIYSWTIEQINRDILLLLKIIQIWVTTICEDHNTVIFQKEKREGGTYNKSLVDRNINLVSSIKYQCGWTNIWSVPVHFNEFWIVNLCIYAHILYENYDFMSQKWEKINKKFVLLKVSSVKISQTLNYSSFPPLLQSDLRSGK